MHSLNLEGETERKLFVQAMPKARKLLLLCWASESAGCLFIDLRRQDRGEDKIGRTLGSCLICTELIHFWK